jgi:hypothetical protein
MSTYRKVKYTGSVAALTNTRILYVVLNSHTYINPEARLFAELSARRDTDTGDGEVLSNAPLSD